MLRSKFIAIAKLPALVILLALLFCSTSANAASVGLQWNSNQEPDLAGYQILYGTTAGQYIKGVDVGNHTSFRISGLEPGRRYFFAVVAYSTIGLKSGPSQEVSAIAEIRPLALTSLFATTGFPVSAGTAVAFVAMASGGTESYQYKWMLRTGSTTSVLQPWSPNNTFVWSPAVTDSGSEIVAWVRDSSNSVDAPATSSAAGKLTVTVLPASASDPGSLFQTR